MLVCGVLGHFWTACLTATSRCWLSSALAFHLLVSMRILMPISMPALIRGIHLASSSHRCHPSQGIEFYAMKCGYPPLLYAVLDTGLTHAIALNILGGIDLAAPIFAILVLRSPCLSVDPFTLG